MDRLEAKQASLDRERANMQANERGNAEQDAKNQEVDELISRLMQCDEVSLGDRESLLRAA